ncbi:hypothetical protein ACHQM5_008887 [Ranunculus cassubicifolius]
MLAEKVRKFQPLKCIEHINDHRQITILSSIKLSKGTKTLQCMLLLCAFNSTTRACLDRIQPDDGPLSLLQLCRLGVILCDLIDIAGLTKLLQFVNFGFHHFNLSWRNIGVAGLVDCLVGNSGSSATNDWILPDLTGQGSIQLNFHLHTLPNTFYFNYATKQTRKSWAQLF